MRVQHMKTHTEPVQVLQKAHKDLVLRVVQETNHDEPSACGIGKLLCWENEYGIGVNQIPRNTYKNAKEMLVMEVPDWRQHIVRPVFLSDHFMFSLNTTGFPPSVESRQLGWIFIGRKEARERLGVFRLRRENQLEIETMLMERIKAYEASIRGEMYTFELVEKGTVIESATGFYGEFEGWKTKIVDLVGSAYRKEIEKILELV